MNRKYSDAELRTILEKAVQEGNSEPGAGTEGLSLAEIKEIGAEVGIDAGSLERAARSMAPLSERRPFALAGASTAVSIERHVNGSLDSVPTSRIISAIRERMGILGEISELNGVLEWRSSGQAGHHVITLSCNDGVTTIAGMANLRQLAVVTHLPAAYLGLVGSVIGFMISANDANVVGMALAAAVVPAVLLTTRMIFARLSRSESRRLERVVDELAALVSSSDHAGGEADDTS